MVKTPGNDAFSKKIQTLNTHNGSTKPRLDHGSKKSMLVNPVSAVIQEKTDKSRRVIDNVRSLKTGNVSTKTGVHHGSTKSEPTSPKGQVVQEKHKKSNTVFKNGQSKEQMFPKSKKDETHGSTSQNNGRVAASESKETENLKRLGKLAKENDDVSPKKLKFKQGKIIDPQDESNGSRKLEFEEGKRLDENPVCQEDGISLRRLSSDGELYTAEDNSVTVSLKPCDLEAKKRHIRANNVIKETASKLIQTRKSKVKALVGAFEMISGNNL
uniref:uncharacterized protein LOC122608972 n=1 Tax=Erigeron canadensis TaxID=72917 RepID=UPI001CB91327|nr:uncharacterized protein LOC122608972 [Erigeron canadensis]